MSKDSPQLMDIWQAATFSYLQEIKKFIKQNPDVLKYLLVVDEPYTSLRQTLTEILALQGERPDPKIHYPTLYKKFHNAMERIAVFELNDKAKRIQPTPLDVLFLQVYENDNKIHEQVYQQIIHPHQLAADKKALQKNIKQRSTNPSKLLDIRHPDNPLNAFFTSMLGIDYHPLKKNNVPYVSFSSEQLPDHRMCLRIGAQTQADGVLNPTFQRYLLANAKKARGPIKSKRGPSGRTVDLTAPEQPYQYVYISLLKRSQSAQDTRKTGISKAMDRFVRYSEGKRATAVEQMKLHPDLKVAAITLPADGEFFLGRFSMKKGGVVGENERVNCQRLLEEIKKSIRANKNDFYFSDDVKSRLFGKNINNGQVERLFELALKDMLGHMPGKSLAEIEITQEQRSALLFQFVKSNLTSYIMDTLNPRAYNISCKDAIDRGAIHSLWYHMDVKFKTGNPMKEEEFRKHLDAPALVVKYRALNVNRNLIWNALNQRMKADPDFAKAHAWAHKWLVDNSPAALTKQHHAHTRLAAKKAKALKKDLKQVKGDIVAKTRALGKEISKLGSQAQKGILSDFSSLKSNKKKKKEDTTTPTQHKGKPLH